MWPSEAPSNGKCEYCLTPSIVTTHIWLKQPVHKSGQGDAVVVQYMVTGYCGLWKQTSKPRKLLNKYYSVFLPGGLWKGI